jgi:hypothetical protein
VTLFKFCNVFKREQECSYIKKSFASIKSCSYLKTPIQRSHKTLCICLGIRLYAITHAIHEAFNKISFYKLTVHKWLNAVNFFKICVSFIVIFYVETLTKKVCLTVDVPILKVYFSASIQALPFRHHYMIIIHSLFFYMRMQFTFNSFA